MTDKISLSLIKSMRERTNLGVLACKQALIKTNGNINLAIQYVRRLGLIQSQQKISVQSKTCGIILVKVKKEKNIGILIEINSESDFVAKNEMFNDFGKKVINTMFEKNISDIDILRNFFRDKIEYLTLQFGENINIRRIKMLHGKHLSFYLHLQRIGVIVDCTDTNDKLNQKIAMHIAASNPRYINVNCIPKHIIDQEYNIHLKNALNLGKTHVISEQVANGRMKKFFENVVLEEQYFIFDAEKKIKYFLIKNDIDVKNFIRFELGEDC
ncbi:MAG: translation elongation factor Ts [Wigglesworthia glossinidia]|nr:translation elongation factor Ts [Wigglesworthia glossinidia]